MTTDIEVKDATTCEEHAIQIARLERECESAEQALADFKVQCRQTLIDVATRHGYDHLLDDVLSAIGLPPRPKPHTVRRLCTVAVDVSVMATDQEDANSQEVTAELVAAAFARTRAITVLPDHFTCAPIPQ